MFTLNDAKRKSEKNNNSSTVYEHSTKRVRYLGSLPYSNHPSESPRTIQYESEEDEKDDGKRQIGCNRNADIFSHPRIEPEKWTNISTSASSSLPQKKTAHFWPIERTTNAINLLALAPLWKQRRSIRKLTRSTQEYTTFLMTVITQQLK